MVTKKTTVQSIYGTQLLLEELNAHDTNTGHPFCRIQLSISNGGLVLCLMMLMCAIVICYPVVQLDIVNVKMVLLAVLVFGIFWHSMFHRVATGILVVESVIAVGNIGIKVTGGRKWWGGCGLSRFIPLSKINDVIINEAIYRHRVIFYLALLINDAETIEIIPLFTSQMPRLKTILLIYKTLQSTLNISSSNRHRHDSINSLLL